MFIGKSFTYYTSDGEQHASRGDFLMLATLTREDNTAPQPLYAAIRKVAMSQLGHFMMGIARVGGVSLILSGPIGHDGLPLASWNTTGLTDELIERYFVPVPAHVVAAYWGSHGHNDCGESTPVLLAYGRELAKTHGRTRNR